MVLVFKSDCLCLSITVRFHYGSSLVSQLNTYIIKGICELIIIILPFLPGVEHLIDLTSPLSFNYRLLNVIGLLELLTQELLYLRFQILCRDVSHVDQIDIYSACCFTRLFKEEDQGDWFVPSLLAFYDH